MPHEGRKRELILARKGRSSSAGLIGPDLKNNHYEIYYKLMLQGTVESSPMNA